MTTKRRTRIGVTILALAAGTVFAYACTNSTEVGNGVPDASPVDAQSVDAPPALDASALDASDAAIGDAPDMSDAANDHASDASDAATGDASDASDASDGGGDAALPPSCIDGTQNGDETDVDCGGSCAQKCADGMGCSAGSDCASGACQGNVCQAPASNDGVKNGTETDVDCGGGAPTNAPRCGYDKTCGIGGDCATGVCSGGKCSCAGGLAFGGAAAMTIPGGVPVEVAGTNVIKHVEAWILPSVGAGVLGIVRLGNDAGGCGTPACGGVTFRFAVNNGALYLDVSQGGALSTITVPTNAWTFVFAGYDAGSYYVGKIEAGVVTRQTLAISNGITRSVLAAGQGSAIGVNLGATYFRGAIDGVRIWSTVPFDAELLARYQSRVPATVPGLVRQWWMEEGTGTTTFEDVTSGATLLGGATWTTGHCQ